MSALSSGKREGVLGAVGPAKPAVKVLLWAGELPWEPAWPWAGVLGFEEEQWGLPWAGVSGLKEELSGLP